MNKISKALPAGCVLFLMICVVSAQYAEFEYANDNGDCWYHERYFPPSAGGSLTLKKGSCLTIPNGSLGEGVRIWGEVCRFDMSDNMITGITFGPGGTAFNPPATLTIRYFGEFKPSDQVACYFWDEENSTWVIVDAYHDVDDKSFHFKIPHFSLYAVSSNREDLDIVLDELN